MVTVVAELGIIALAALFGGVLASIFRQPSVVGLLLAGAIIGPSALGLVTQTELVETMAELGAALLLFMMGMEFSIGKLIKVGLRAFVIATFKVAFVFIIAYEVALLMGMTLFEALVLGALISITSTAIVVKVLADKGMKKRPEAKLLVAALIIEDIFAVFLLTFFSSLQAGGGGASAASRDLLFPFLTAIGILALIYFVVEKFLRVFLALVLRYRTDESLVLTAVAMAVGLSYAAGLIGLEPSLGAFVAGSMVATLPGGHMVERSTKAFGAVFAALFFLSMGMLIAFDSVLANAQLIIVFSFITIVASFIGMGLGAYLAGIRGKMAVFCGIAMLSVGEFSLLLARGAKDLVQFDVIGVIAMVVLISTVATSIFIGSSARIHALLVAAAPGRFRLQMHQLSEYFGSVLTKFEPGGPFFSTFSREGRAFVSNLAVVVVMLGAATLLSAYFGGASMDIGGFSVSLAYIFYLAALLLVIYPIIYALDAFKEILDELTSSFRLPKNKDEGLGRVVLRDLALLAGCILLAVYMPLILSTLRLEQLWFVSLAPIFVAFMLVWEVMKHVHEIVDLRTGRTHSGRLGELVDSMGLPLLRFRRLGRLGRREGKFVPEK